MHRKLYDLVWYTSMIGCLILITSIIAISNIGFCNYCEFDLSIYLGVCECFAYALI